MQEPIYCPHGGECYLLDDSAEYWSVPCPRNVCDKQTVAPAQRDGRDRKLLLA